MIRLDESAAPGSEAGAVDAGVVHDRSDRPPTIFSACWWPDAAGAASAINDARAVADSAPTIQPKEDTA